jgi:hypothetical protein
MKKVNSVSGGMTSAYMAAMFPADYNLFSLVRIEDKNCKFKDEKIRKIVEDKIQAPFVATAEDDTIIYTMLDLEQFLGKEVIWVTGATFDEVVKTKGGWLPNKLHRYCTSYMKLEPMVRWWKKEINEVCEMRLGFRANETNRVQRTIEKLNRNGNLEYKISFEKNKHGKNKWVTVEWQKPVFPLVFDLPTHRDQIVSFWKDKTVRFAKMNNCVGCFHKHPLLLNQQFKDHPEKMEWFNNMEKFKQNKNKKATWRSDVTYQQIKDFNPQFSLFSDEDIECESGYCGI